MTVLAGLLASCGSTGGTQDDGARESAGAINRTGASSASATRAGPRIAVPLHPPSAVSDSARLEGRVALEGRCLVVTDLNGDGPVLVAFPAGATAYDERNRVLTYKGKAYPVGARIVLGGGFSPLAASTPGFISGLPDECRREHVFVAD